MKSFGIWLSLIAAASAGVPKPEILVGINVGEEQSGSLGGIEPRIKWATNGQVAGFDVEVRHPMTLRPMAISSVSHPLALLLALGWNRYDYQGCGGSADHRDLGQIQKIH